MNQPSISMESWKGFIRCSVGHLPARFHRYPVKNGTDGASCSATGPTSPQARAGGMDAYGNS